MDRIEINMAGTDLVFSVKYERDDGADAPWRDYEDHGPVSDWVRRNKRPGELVLNSGRGYKRFYDFVEACKIARRDGWDSAPYNDGSETKRQQAAKAARSDFEYLRGWCQNEWEYVGVIVTLLSPNGEETEVTNSVWGVETFGDRHEQQARELADDLAHGMHTRWELATQTTYKLIPTVGKAS